MQIRGVMLTHKMCETCSIDIQLSTRLPSPKFLKAVFTKLCVFHFLNINSQTRKALDIIYCP